MHTSTLVYLLTKHKRQNLVKKPAAARYIAVAYNNVIAKLNDFGGATIKNTDIDALDITDHMKSKLKHLMTQKITAAERAEMRRIKLYNDLTKTMGIGKTKANELIKLGLTDVKQLKLKKWQKHLNADTIMLLKHNPSRAIPHSAIKKIEKKLTSFNGAMLVGGYLRKKPFSKDIDVMIVVPKKEKEKEKNVINEYIAHLRKLFPLEVYSKGSDKASLVIKVDIKKRYYKLDVFAAPNEYKHGMLLYATGSKQHNIKMRSVARRKGYLLNQRGLHKGKKLIKVSSERDIFKLLSMSYVKPENR